MCAQIMEAEQEKSFTLTGGEPTLALDAMEYIADGLKQRGVLLLKLDFPINGLVYMTDDNRCEYCGSAQ